MGLHAPDGFGARDRMPVAPGMGRSRFLRWRLRAQRFEWLVGWCDGHNRSLKAKNINDPDLWIASVTSTRQHVPWARVMLPVAIAYVLRFANIFSLHAIRSWRTARQDLASAPKP